MSKVIPFKSKNKPAVRKKTPEEVMAEKNMGVMNTIITQTLTRHAGLSEKAYLKKIGFKGVKISEEKAVRIARFNVIVELTKTYLSCIQKINLIKNMYEVCLGEAKNG